VTDVQTANFSAQKILVIKRDAIGDVISLTPFLEVLRRSFPEAQIVYLVGSWSRAALKDNPDIDELVVVDSKKWQSKLSPFVERSRLVKKLKKYNFDTVFILQGPAPFSFWEKFALRIGATKRIGFRNNGAKTTLTDSVELPPHKGHLFKTLDKNRAEHYLDLLRKIGISNTKNNGNHLYCQPSDLSFAAKFFEDNNLTGKKVVAICPGGAKNPGMNQLAKRWPLQRYVDLATELIKEEEAEIILIGGPGDQAVNQKLIQKMPNGWRGKVFDTAGQTTIHQSAALIEKSDLFVGNDSGPLHIASTTKTPIVGIFGPTNPVVDGPYKPKGEILFKKTKYAPCYTSNCAGHPPCIEEISVTDATKACQRILNNPK